MTDGTDNPQATDFPDPPPTLAEGLLQASLERPLTASELGQLRAAAEADPAVADDCATFGLLAALRLEQRMAWHEAPAWEAFQKLARRHAAVRGVPRPLPPAARRLRPRLLQWIAALRPAIPGLAAFAMVIVVFQAGALLWLAQRPVQEDAMRGGGTDRKGNCPAVLVHLAPQATAGELTRVLTQVQARVVDGPDGAGAYRVVGSHGFAEDAGALLGGLAQEVQPAPNCVITSK